MDGRKNKVSKLSLFTPKNGSKPKQKMGPTPKTKKVQGLFFRKVCDFPVSSGFSHSLSSSSTSSLGFAAISIFSRKDSATASKGAWYPMSDFQEAASREDGRLQAGGGF